MAGTGAGQARPGNNGQLGAGATRPQPPPSGPPQGRPHGSPRDGLPLTPLPPGFLNQAAPRWIFVGCHGGAGVTTVSRIANGFDGGRYWPVPSAGLVNVVLVARTHADGLGRAQLAARQWADGRVPRSVRLLGLVAVSDAPGKLPKPLRHLLELISGGVPQLWHLPWIEELRLGEPIEGIRLPAPYVNLTADLNRIVLGAPHA